MADIINTLRGPRFFRKGTIRGMYYIIPVMADDLTTVTFGAGMGRQTHDREYYRLRADGEWHWDHTALGHFQKYPCYEEPEWSLPYGI